MSVLPKTLEKIRNWASGTQHPTTPLNNNSSSSNTNPPSSPTSSSPVSKDHPSPNTSSHSSPNLTHSTGGPSGSNTNTHTSTLNPSLSHGTLPLQGGGGNLNTTLPLFTPPISSGGSITTQNSFFQTNLTQSLRETAHFDNYSTSFPPPAPQTYKLSHSNSQNSLSSVSNSQSKPVTYANANELKAYLHDLSPSEPLQTRIKTLKDFSDIVSRYLINDVEIILYTIEDLLREGVPLEARQATFIFLAILVESQNDQLGDVIRSKFYNIVRKHTKMEDFPYKLSILKKLTKEGRDISCFEKNIATLILSWMSAILSLEPPKQKLLHKEIVALLELTTNVVKFNFAFFEEEEISQLITGICRVCLNSQYPAEVEHCLNFMDVVVRYGVIPQHCLVPYVQTLCRTVNAERYCFFFFFFFFFFFNSIISKLSIFFKKNYSFSKQSWQILRNLLKSHCAWNSIKILCETLENPANRNAGNLLRGAIFFIGNF